MTAITSLYSRPDDGTFRFANNVFAKAGYKLTGNLYANAGIGYLTTKEFHSVDYPAMIEYDRLEQLSIHGYVTVPVGFTYYLGSFFVNPEIGIGWNVYNKMKDAIFYSDGTEVGNEWVDKNNVYDMSKTTFPLFLTIGDEFRFNNWSILIGLKGYYSLNDIGGRATYPRHYYGFGIMTGVKF